MRSIFLITLALYNLSCSMKPYLQGPHNNNSYMKKILIFTVGLIFVSCLFEKESSKASYTSFEVGKYYTPLLSHLIVIEIQQSNAINIKEIRACLVECRGHYNLNTDTLTFSNRECRGEIGYQCEGINSTLLSEWAMDSTISYPLKILNSSNFEIIYYNEEWLPFKQE